MNEYIMAKILLLEPGYRNKYPPLGLMKIAAYHRGKGDFVRFSKGVNSELLNSRWDRIYVTTLFSFEYKKISQEIDFAIECARNQQHRVFVGGIAVSLMTEEFVNEPKWAGVRFISGLLDKAPAKSLQLDEFRGDIYADDNGTPIEDYIPDYSILDDIRNEYIYPVRDAYFGYASRGCIRKCHFCGVPKLEGAQRDGMPLSELISGINKTSGEKRDLILMDNNVTASPNFDRIIDEIHALGFHRNAVFSRDGGKGVKRRVDFNQGVDARILSRDPSYLKKMSTICISPLRIAFDHLGVRKHYVKSVNFASEFGITHLSNYMLYNFYDTPDDLYERMRINIDLNEQLGIRIWSFPMRYQPVTLKDRSHIGPKWTWYQLRSFQLILQATHGVVSGSPSFFRRAFGDGVDEFHRILLLPHNMIFFRDYYDRFEGKAEKNEFLAEMAVLTELQKEELLNILAKPRSSNIDVLKSEINGVSDKRIRSLLKFYEPVHKSDRMEIIERMQKNKLHPISSAVDPALTDDVKVEDAGLFDENDDIPAGSSNNKSYFQDFGT